MWLFLRKLDIFCNIFLNNIKLQLEKKLGDIVDVFCFQENNLDLIIPLYIGTQIVFIMTYAAFGLLLIIKCQFIAKTSQYQKAKTKQFPRSKSF